MHRTEVSANNGFIIEKIFKTSNNQTSGRGILFNPGISVTHSILLDDPQRSSISNRYDLIEKP